MAVIGLLQEALVRCGDCPDSLCHIQQDHRAVRELEKAAALYVGSTEGQRSLYQLADEGSFLFNTRNDTNLEILGRMQLTSEDLSRGLCRSARERVAEIEKYMIVLLLQGVVRNAYILSTPQPEYTVYDLTYDISYYWRTTPEMVWGQAEAFAAAVLPLVYQCDRAKVLDLYYEMFDSNSPDWEMVKYIVVGVSECLDIKPDELGGLGGLWKRDEGAEPYSSKPNKPIIEDYFDGTEPVLSEPNNSPSSTILTVAIAVFAVVAVGCLSVQLKNKLSPPKKQQEKEQPKKQHMSNDEKDDEELQK